MKTLPLAAAVIACLCAGTAPAATVYLSPGTQTLSSGSPVTLDLNISGLGNGTALSAFDISVNFDSADLSFEGAAFGDPVLGDQLDLGDLGLNGPTATPGNGTVDLIETDIFDSSSTLLSEQAANFTMVVLTFDALAGGTTPVTATINSLADQESNPFTASTQNASVTIEASPVPLPSSLVLLTAGLLGLVAASCRRRRASPLA